MTTIYTLTAIIDPAQVVKLKADGSGMFLGKAVQDASGNSTINLVWNSNEFMQENSFTWQESYSIPRAADNTVAAIATASTVIQPIGLGQSVIIDAAGELGPASGAVYSGPITLYKNDDKVDFSALLHCTGPKGTTQTPVCLSMPLQAGSKVELTPIVTVAVWFSANYAISTVIPDASDKAHKVEYLNGATAHTISWLQKASGKWEWQTTA